ncbi:hypothetical protein EV424DRAFT_1353780 [Suillus variegatus]|nr:hypothetical protein EV424DRAFT_1353780 [Suillus variegatus]
MPYTKQTAKKATDGKTLCMQLNMPLQEERNLQESTKYCIVCCNGSFAIDSLFYCEECPYMTYTKCLNISGDFKHIVVGKDVIFICICCHLMKQCKNRLSLLYFGFYRDD